MSSATSEDDPWILLRTLHAQGRLEEEVKFDGEGVQISDKIWPKDLCMNRTLEDSDLTLEDFCKLLKSISHISILNLKQVVKFIENEAADSLEQPRAKQISLDNGGSISRDNLNLLPDELLLRILSFLSLEDITKRISLVSTRFRDICLDPSLWTKVKLPNSRLLSHQRATRLLKRCTKLRELEMDNRPIDGEFLATQALQHCPMLEKLKLHHCTYAIYVGKLIKAVGKFGANSLRSFDFGGELDQRGIVMMTSSLQHLTELKLNLIDFTYLVRDELWIALGANCKKLELIHIDWNIQDFGVHLMLDAVQDTLRDLSLNRICNLTGTTLESIGHRCRQLQNLSIIDQQQAMGQSHLEDILSLPRLRQLYIYINRDSVPALNNTMLLPMTGILELALYGFLLEDTTLGELAGKFPELTILCLHNNMSIKGLREVMLRCSKLRALKLNRMAVMPGEQFPHSSSLRTLQLRDCCISFDSLREIQDMMPLLHVDY